MRTLLIVFLFFTVSAGAQQVPSAIVNSCGGSAGSSPKIISSIGEPLVGTVNSQGVYLRQGFLIPKYSGITTIGEPDRRFFIYPNPVEGSIKIRATLTEVTSCAIFNMLGQRVKLLAVVGNEVQVADLSPGLYVITLMDSRKNRLATFNFLKK